MASLPAQLRQGHDVALRYRSGADGIAPQPPELAIELEERTVTLNFPGGPIRPGDYRPALLIHDPFSTFTVAEIPL